MTDEAEIRASIIAQCRAMNASGLNQGTSGNISARLGDRMLITPSAIPYDAMTPDMIAAMPIDGEYGAWEGPKKPSSEWRFHLDILRARPEVGAIVHTHSTYCTSLSIARMGIPAIHYMIAHFGGPDIRCSPYALYGSAELSAHVLKAMEGRNGCLPAAIIPWLAKISRRPCGWPWNWKRWRASTGTSCKSGGRCCSAMRKCGRPPRNSA